MDNNASLCAIGYKGNLCYECEDGYAKTSKGDYCVRCDENFWYHFLNFVLIVIPEFIGIVL